MPPLTRRLLLGGALAAAPAALLSGCSDDVPTVSVPHRKRTLADLTADERSVVKCIHDLDGTTLELRELVHDSPRLAARLRGVRTTLAEHLKTFERAATKGKLPVGQRGALTITSGQDRDNLSQAIRVIEQQLRQYVDAAEHAESGQFAWLLASMAASLSQHLAELR